MSKAFTSEDRDDGASRCPGCGRAGSRVSSATLEAHVRPDARAHLGSDLAFCPFPNCAVGYYDALGQSVPAGALADLGYPKRTDPAAIVCYCERLAVGDVSPARVAGIRAALDRGAGDCERAHPAGRRCVADLVRLARSGQGR